MLNCYFMEGMLLKYRYRTQIRNVSLILEPNRIARSFFAIWILYFVISSLLLFWPGQSFARKRIHEVYYEGSDYELNVYRIYGKKEGKTLLLIGGIQGDEPGGFLSADHYADFSLAKGNLIVVPRANFQSILLKRRKINEDMNRKFAEDKQFTYETNIVNVLKKLIAESDGLLNLHDGSGFYSSKWESPQRNPKRYGQSIIADAETFVNQKTGQVIELGKIARDMVKKINVEIENPRHYFHFNDHQTVQKDSQHKEQRKSATFYALYTHSIPAFGIETSKSLPMETKVRHHNLAINAFMEYLGIVPENPGINLEKPQLNYLVIAVNDALPVVLKDKQTLRVRPGDQITVSHIEANYKRGLTVDIKGVGSYSDLRKKVSIHQPTRIVVRKDYYPCGEVYIELDQRLIATAQSKQGVKGSTAFPVIKAFKIRVNGRLQFTENYGNLSLVKGDTLELVDVVTESGNPVNVTVNFKGFVGNRKFNTGEDRGYVIHTERGLWKRYSLKKKGNAYPVIVTYQGKHIGKMIVHLKKPASKPTSN